MAQKNVKWTDSRMVTAMFLRKVQKKTTINVWYETLFFLQFALICSIAKVFKHNEEIMDGRTV